MKHSSNRQSGFTLLELLVAMLIAISAISLVAPRFSALIPGVEIKGEAQKVAALLRYTRSRSIAEGEVISLIRVDDPLGIEITHSNDLYTWPSSVTLEVYQEIGKSDAPQQIHFHPDGSSSGGEVTLSSGDLKYRVTVDWLSGRVSIHD